MRYGEDKEKNHKNQEFESKSSGGWISNQGILDFVP